MPVLYLDSGEPYAYISEVPTMTFEVGIVGTDGIVLASDKKYTSLGLETKESFMCGKIEIDPELGLAYCCAGDDLCVTVVENVLSGLRQPIHNRLTKELLIIAAQTAITKEPEGRSKRQGRELTGGQALFAFQRPHPHLWHLCIRIPPLAFRIDDKVCIGAPGNLARFFAEKYVRPEISKASTRTLQLLAAHLVLMAESIDSSSVAGLEIVTCSASGFVKESDERISELVSQSRALDAHTKAALYG